MDNLLAIILFAISSSVTPGPNNITVMTSGVNFGIRRSLPVFTGICFGFSLMLFLVGIGLGQVFNEMPFLHLLIKVLGVLYLLYFAYLIANAAKLKQSDKQSKPLTFFNGVLFQWLNAKAWVVATGAIAAFTSVGGDYYTQNLIISITFLLISFPCVGIWLLFGSTLKNILQSKRHLQVFNYAMSVLLVISIIPIVKELVT